MTGSRGHAVSLAMQIRQRYRGFCVNPAFACDLSQKGCRLGEFRPVTHATPTSIVARTAAVPTPSASEASSSALISTDESRILAAIERMADAYGPQGWWPVTCERKWFARPNGETEKDGYHPGQFDFPRTRKGRWEICCGAVLTQNTAWTNVRKALAGLRERNITTPERLLSTHVNTLRSVIRPAGYFNQKSGYLRALAEWFSGRDRALSRAERSRALLEIERPRLLSVLGVGPETADSILLYAYALPTFVVDAYTRRVLERLSLAQPHFNYERIRALCERALAQATTTATVRAWQEAHALIVEHAKRHHGRGADVSKDFLVQRDY